MSGAAVMTLTNVRFGYDSRTPVLSDVSLSVELGRVHVLLGPNAAGKTTLLRLMLGLAKPWRGKVRLGRRKVHRLSARTRAESISYVPQRSGMGFAFNVEQMVGMGRYAVGRNGQAVGEAIEQCELTDVAGRVFGELSVGQQQRVLLARAIAQCRGGGRMMLLDEPTSAMDLAHVHRTMRLLRQIARSGVAVVAVVQDVNLAARYADRVWLMRGGEIVADGEWYDVMKPSILEPVYGVRLRTTVPADRLGPASERPVFDVRLPEFEGV